MAAWGLLKGLGDGLSFAGATMAKTQEEKAKEARLEAYRQATLAEERQYQEEKTKNEWEREDSQVKAERSYVDNGRAYKVDINASGEQIGDPRDQGPVKEEKRNLVSGGRGTIYDADAGQWLTSPGWNSGAASGQSAPTQQIKQVRNADGTTSYFTWDGQSATPVEVPGPAQPQGPSKEQVSSAMNVVKMLDKKAGIVGPSALSDDERALYDRAVSVIGASISPPTPTAGQGDGGLLTKPNQEPAPPKEQDAIRKSFGNPDAMRKVLRELNPGASDEEIEAGVAAAMKKRGTAPATEAPVKESKPATKPDKASTLDEGVEKYRTPTPTFGKMEKPGDVRSGPQAQYQKVLKDVVANVKEDLRYSRMQYMDENKMRLALNGNLTQSERRAIVAELERRAKK